ncbi:ACE-like protein, partial [Mya arenaria]
MYVVAEEFFTSIGLKKMPDTFWTHSMLKRPPDRDVVIKQCTIVTGDQFNTVHHEMGHVQYYLEYINQPYLYRRGANPGFHEGVADIASLCQYQGVSPPVERSEDDFDPGAKYHIASNTPYISYFVSFVLQFQWHQALCELIGKAEPLHRCDIYRNITAGNRLKEMLQMGASKQWAETLFTLTKGTSGETRKLSVAPLLSYFKPLQ